MAEMHPLKPFYSVLVLAFACSAMVAAAAVGLRPLQEANRSLDQKKNILAAAGILEQDIPIVEQFQAVEPRIVDLASGRFVEPDRIDPESFDQLGAAFSKDMGSSLERDVDSAGIRRLEKYSLVYLVSDGDTVSQIVFPVRGKGLWSTMYAYVAVASDLTTVRGVSFYEHGETPGLGGEVENPRWQAGWQDKKLYSPDGQMNFRVVKSGTQSNPEEAVYRVDGLSGATLTTQGVDKLMAFWFGEHGFEPFLEVIRQQGGFNG
jgi:Na+-transporting NADH:ubiquinone oxidoreductase subunit C